jgi:hypothetical protein
MWSNLKYAGAAALAAAALTAANVSYADDQPTSVDRFTATTVSMTPADIQLRIDVREWSDEAGRAAVVDALANESDVATALRELPTLGYVWRSDSGVGYSVKYAHRIETQDGERVTFVTDKKLGAHDFKPWAADGGASVPELDYSVIELYLSDGESGDGSLSLGANVELDRQNQLVHLDAAADAPRLLKDAKLEPKPYWAKGS